MGKTCGCADGAGLIKGIAVAFIGAMLIVKPGISVMTATSLLPLLGAMSFTTYDISTCFLCSYSLIIYLFLKDFIGIFLSSTVVPFLWQPIALNEVPEIAALVFFGILGHLLMIRAFTAASTSYIVPYGYAELLFSISFGFTLFNETSDLISLLGVIVIVGAGIYAWYPERITQAQKSYG